MAPTILLVEPDVDNRHSWKRLLRRSGFRTVCAQNGRAAIHANQELRPDLIVLRDVLPDMPGLEMSRRIRQDARSRMTPLLLLRSANRRTELDLTDPTGIDEVVDDTRSAAEKLARIQEWLEWRTQIDQQAESALLSLARCLESKDPGTDGHGERLSAYAVRLGDSLGLGGEQIQALAIGGVLHDIGKVGVPDGILLKPGPLTIAERAILREHPVTGERICAPLKAFHYALPIIRHHHERMDGSGYPDGLKNDAIPLTARILQTVDIYDALTTDRPYRKALATGDALAIMRQEVQRGWMDGALVNQMANLLNGLRSDAQFVDFCHAYRTRDGFTASTDVPARSVAVAETEPMRLTDWLRLGEVQMALPRTACRAY